MSSRRSGQINVRRVISPSPIAKDEGGVVEQLLARLVAIAYATDHPNQFPSKKGSKCT